MMRLNTRAGLMALALALVSASALFAGRASAADGPRKFVSLAIANPRGVAVDKAGNLYVADVDAAKVYKITEGGDVSTVAGAAAVTAPLAVSVAADGTLLVTDLDNAAVLKISPDGMTTPVDKGASAAALSSPAGAVMDHAGNVFVANNSNNVILKITADGKASIFAGTAGATGGTDGTGSDARFASPRGIAIDGKDNLYVADEANSNIRKITPEGVVTTLAGTAGKSGAADGKGPAAQFGAPLADGKRGWHRLRRRYRQSTHPQNHPGRSGDNSGRQVGRNGQSRRKRPRRTIRQPAGIAVDGAGNVFVADSDNGGVREVSPDGTVTTVVGTK